jgi:hypothetical protein
MMVGIMILDRCDDDVDVDAADDYYDVMMMMMMMDDDDVKKLSVVGVSE